MTAEDAPVVPAPRAGRRGPRGPQPGKTPPKDSYPRGEFGPQRIRGLTNHGPGKAPGLKHGAGDLEHASRALPVKCLELAQQLADVYLDGYCPEQLRMPQFLPAVESWARREARARLLSDWLDGMTVDQMTSPQRKGALKVPFELWAQAENMAAKGRKDLGLDPASYAGIMKDLGIAGRAQDDAIGRLGAQGAAIRQARQASVTPLRDDGNAG
jgi:hypothetical protein